MPSVDAFIAATRFGLGPRPGELAEIDADPRAWIIAQIEEAQTIPENLRHFPAAADILKGIHEARLRSPEALRKETRRAYRETLFQELREHANHMIMTRRPFAERMVLFWSNHFTVSTSKPLIGPSIAAYHREAIRPHIFGRFEDMLVAVVRHPSMISYLDNQLSMGPNSPAARRSGRGLNENLAREILELHTLGVDGGYTQSDVTEFAKILTGWRHGALGGKRARQFFGPVHGDFEYFGRAHEPGPKHLLGRRYSEDGEREGMAALKHIAGHPSTARFLATKLARHFIADDPPPSAVAKLARAFQDSGGHLGQMSAALVAMNEVWADPLPKVKTPLELILSTLRAAGADGLGERRFLLSLRELGHRTFAAPSPAGWPDRARDWIAPEALMRRIEWVRQAVARLPGTLNPVAVAAATIGPVMSAPTAKMIAAAPSVQEGLELLFAAHEFQRR